MEFTKESLSVDKLQYSLMDPVFQKEVVAVLTLGAKKYSPDNWKKCPNKSLYVDALLRHIEDYRMGIMNDEETGLSHIAHATCNLMFLHWMEKEYNESEQSSSTKLPEGYAEALAGSNLRSSERFKDSRTTECDSDV